MFHRFPMEVVPILGFFKAPVPLPAIVSSGPRVAGLRKRVWMGLTGIVMCSIYDT